MRSPDDAAPVLAKLKRVTAHVHAMIEDGSFYALPSRERRRYIRSVKRLYNRLRGPKYDFRSGGVLSGIAPIVLLVAGCNLGPPANARGTIGLRLSLSDSLQAVDRFELTVSATDMEPIERVFDRATTSIAIEVPSGLNREVNLLAIPRPAERFAIPLRGVTTVDLMAGETRTVTLSMQPDRLEPSFAAPVADPFGLPSAAGDNHAIPTLGDLDGDGDLDLMLGDYYFGSMNWGEFRYYENTGSISEAEFVGHADNPNPFALPYTEYSMVVPRFADLDGDGNVDLIVAHSTLGDAYLRLFKYVDEEFTEVTVPLPSLYSAERAVVTLGDLDGDGDLDVLIGYLYGGEGYRIAYFENIGTTTEPEFGGPQMNPFGLTAIPAGVAPVLADLDSDGTLDILAGSADGNLYYFENVGTPTAPQFAASVQNPFGLQNPSPGTQVVPAVGDLDGDGDLDLLVGEYGGQGATLYYFENTTR